MSTEFNPYASPPEAIPPILASGPPPPPYTPLSGPAAFAVAMLTIMIIGDAISSWSSYMQAQLLQRIEAGQDVPMQELEANDTREALIAVALLGALIITMIAFLIWFHRAYRNLPSLGATDLKSTPGWAVGGWFIPFYNLVHPYRVAKEIFNKSDPRSVELNAATSSSLVGWWWGIYLLSGFVASNAGLFGDEPPLQELITATWRNMASNALGILAAVLAIAMVKRITTNQEARSSPHGNGDLLDTQKGMWN